MAELAIDQRPGDFLGQEKAKEKSKDADKKK